MGRSQGHQAQPLVQPRPRSPDLSGSAALLLLLAPGDTLTLVPVTSPPLGLVLAPPGFLESATVSPAVSTQEGVLCPQAWPLPRPSAPAPFLRGWVPVPAALTSLVTWSFLPPLPGFPPLNEGITMPPALVGCRRPGSTLHLAEERTSGRGQCRCCELSHRSKDTDISRASSLPSLTKFIMSREARTVVAKGTGV